MIDVSSENLSKLSNQMFEDFIVRSTYDLATRYPYVQLNHTFESLKAYVSSRFAMYKKQGLQYYSTLAFNVELHFLFGHNFQNNPLYRQIREQLQPDSSQDESYYYSTLYDVVSEQCEQTHGDENQHFHQAVKDAEKLYQNREQLDPILITQYLQQVFPTKYHYFEQHLSADMERFLAKMAFLNTTPEQIILQFVLGDDYRKDPLLNLIDMENDLSNLFKHYSGV